MIASHSHSPAKPTMLMNALLILAILLSFLSLGFAMATNSLLGWIGLIILSPYAAYQSHKRFPREARHSFWIAYWVFLGLPFTFNALYGSLWWLAYWPVTLTYIFAFSALSSDKPEQ